MTSWRDSIVQDFVPNVSKLTLVADPDGLLVEEKLAIALREKGFDLVEFEDSVTFRYAYESKYRAVWDRGEQTDLVVALRWHDTELDSLPYDLLQAGRRLSFNLGELFPNLSYAVLEELDRNLLDSVFEAQTKFSPGRMGDNATKDFILRHVFGIAVELIGNTVDLLRTLLRLHYSGMTVPYGLAERVVATLGQSKQFETWPLAQIIPDDKAFFAFLDERWPLFLSNSDDVEEIQDALPRQPLAIPGPELLPFGHEDIRVYVDNLFLER